MLRCIVSVLIVLLASTAWASEESGGEVRIALEDYKRLLELSHTPKPLPRNAPAGYALGRADVTVDTVRAQDAVSASVNVALQIRVLEDDWVLVPVLPPGTPVSSASIAGEEIELIASAQGLAWGVKQSGSYEMQLKYQIDAQHADDGYSLALPLPQAAAMSLVAYLPGSGLNAAVIPSAGTKIAAAGDRTQVSATLPPAAGVQISWRTPSGRSHSISRARYAGALTGDAVSWKAEYSVEIFEDESIELSLLPASLTLSNISVDSVPAPILLKDGFFAALVKGQGAHTVHADFQVPVQNAKGPPQVNFQIPRIPVSQFELILPGKKDLLITPAANVSYKHAENSTVAVAYVPMSETVQLAWNEAVPEEVRTEVNANAGVYHSAHAAEGVLYVHARAIFDIVRGETNVLELSLPADAQINRVASATVGVADWRLAEASPDGRNHLTVFLDQKAKGEIALEVFYDLSLLGGERGKAVPLPLLRAEKVQRQRGMIALLQGKELTLKPAAEQRITRVGENQLPVFMRADLALKVAHTFKYVENNPALSVVAVTPERSMGRFDALVNTLISLGDVTLQGNATIEVNVKSGAISALQLALPANVNLLRLSAPSLRTHTIIQEDKGQLVDVQFTQDLEGQFKIDVAFEHIMNDSQAELRVPALGVKNAEVEQGRIAVEALTAVEVGIASAQKLSRLDPSELPQQLVLRTTNPILHSFKYAQADEPYELVLKITRHKEIEVQQAAIDNARYRTLYTRDGLAVTTASFTVRNSREQFLKIALPPESEVWSVFVDGQAEKPAIAEGTGSQGGPHVLVRIINSAEGFPVELVYQTAVPAVGSFGRLRGVLPKPDMVVTKTRWDVYLPDKLSFGRPQSNMELTVENAYLERRQVEREFELYNKASGQVTRPLQIEVPAAGVRYTFEKLYANKAPEDPYFAIPYLSAGSAYLGRFLSGAAAVLFWLGAFALVRKRAAAAIGQCLSGALVCAVTLVYFGTEPFYALAASGITIALLAASTLKKVRGLRKQPQS